ncbi:MAG: hypothetical protein HQM00_15380 [Magnetococcales bacterium]|nr:hypothetical protein [Magnetococcales bacterium]
MPMLIFMRRTIFLIADDDGHGNNRNPQDLPTALNQTIMNVDPGSRYALLERLFGSSEMSKNGGAHTQFLGIFTLFPTLQQPANDLLTNHQTVSFIARAKYARLS